MIQPIRSLLLAFVFSLVLVGGFSSGPAIAEVIDDTTKISASAASAASAASETEECKSVVKEDGTVVVAGSCGAKDFPCLQDSDCCSNSCTKGVGGHSCD